MKIQEISNLAPGTPLGGGFFAGQFRIGDDHYALVVSPKAQGDLHDTMWGEAGEHIAGTDSCSDGRANTIALAEAGSSLARRILALEIGGHNDWYLPSRDELEICYRNLKPTAQENWASFRDGDNPSSAPVGYPYTKQSPEQTTAAVFQDDAPEAFETTPYWASTQYSADNAWGQGFEDGYQDALSEHYECRARAVRRIQLDH